jgi:ERCC4-related helicase
VSQVIEVKFPNNYNEVRDSIKRVTGDVLSNIETEEVIGYCMVVMYKDGSSTFYESAGLERQRRIGILMDMVHDLLNK